MFAFMWWMLIGLVAGLLARLLVPWRQPMGLMMTILLGMGGIIGRRIPVFRRLRLRPSRHERSCGRTVYRNRRGNAVADHRRQHESFRASSARVAVGKHT